MQACSRFTLWKLFKNMKHIKIKNIDSVKKISFKKMKNQLYGYALSAQHIYRVHEITKLSAMNWLMIYLHEPTGDWAKLLHEEWATIPRHAFVLFHRSNTDLPREHPCMWSIRDLDMVVRACLVVQSGIPRSPAKAEAEPGFQHRGGKENNAHARNAGPKYIDS